MFNSPQGLIQQICDLLSIQGTQYLNLSYGEDGLLRAIHQLSYSKSQARAILFARTLHMPEKASTVVLCL